MENPTLTHRPKKAPSSEYAPSSNMRVRPADLGDLDALVNLYVAATPDHFAWDYCYPYREMFPDDHISHATLLFNDLLAPEYDDWAVMVAEKTHGLRIVAFAAWDMSYLNRRKHGESHPRQNPGPEKTRDGGVARRDTNQKHVNFFALTQTLLNERYLAGFGGEQMHLFMLATHPQHRRQGAGALLTRCGMDKAKADDAVVTLLAGGCGLPLFRCLGFEGLGFVDMCLQGEVEKIVVHAMVWSPTGLDDLEEAEDKSGKVVAK